MIILFTLRYYIERIGATEWSGRPDVTSVKVNIINLSTDKIVDSAIIGGKSTLNTWGGDRPEDLLTKPLTDYASELFK